MGSGCSKNNNTPFCPASDRTSSHCVSWQGEAYPNLGICTGDTITEVGEVILNKLEEFAKGEGIFLKDLTVDCTTLNDKLKATDYSLYQILKLALDNQCSLQSAIDDLKVEVDEIGKITLDLSCLTSETITTRQELDALFLSAICKNKTDIADIVSYLNMEGSTSIVEVIRESIGDFILSKINSCNGGIKKAGSGASATIDLVGMIPIGGRIWGDFDLTKFDSSGKGTDIYCGFALCNGRNGTPDLREVVPGMATNIPGVPKIFATPSNVGDRAGANFSTLKIANLPEHNHVVPPHNHTVKFTTVLRKWYNDPQADAPPDYAIEDTDYLTGETPLVNNSVSFNTTTTIGAASERFENRQPTYYGVWIQRIN